MDGHGFTRRPQGFKGKIRGGVVVGCTGCSWMTVLPLGTPVPQMLKAHYGHLVTIAPTPAADDLQSQLTDLSSRLSAVTGDG